MAEETLPLATRYDPKPVEQKWYSHWESRGYFHAEPDAKGTPYCIVIPPPNITGALHMGHALNNTIQDILVRWRRMQGRNALWMPGTDHAAIATQNVVEKELAKQNLRRQDLGREKFIARFWQWREEYGSRIVSQLKKLGCSCDWERIRFTMDEGFSRAVREAFVRLYERGLIYRGKRLINWCPRCCTALSDDEVEHEEHQGFLWFIKYPFKNEPRLHVTVATTRPETMLGDTAVAVHPGDERFKAFIGQALVLPVMGREIPVIADHTVDPEFGTGAVKVTPAHDPADFQMGLRHNLPQINVMNDDGSMNENAGEYAGMDRFECREALLEELRAKKLLDATQPYTHSVGHCYRCRTVLEPYLSDQWFVKMRPLADAALKAAAEGKVKLHPARWQKVYESWLQNVRDWCISRQLWLGHRIPAWYCESCRKITVSRTDPDRCAHCRSEKIRQDEDVLDTWFSSDLWPFGVLGWPEETPMLRTFYPTSVLVTARDIIYLWVARMVTMGLEMAGEAPFDDVYIHGTILDEQGRRMSKSLGNGVDPLDIISEYGADAMRFTLVSLTAEGQDVRLSTDKFEMGRNFANKIWNASRFALMNLSVGKGEPGRLYAKLELEDQWILSRLNTVVRTVSGALEAFQFNEAARAIYEFAWGDFCDWYLEIIKPRLADTATASPVRNVVAHVLDRILRLLHPFMPHLTEEVWQLLRSRVVARGDLAWPGAEFPETILFARWPDAESTNVLSPGAGGIDFDVEALFAMLQNIITSVRNIRSKLSVPERKPLDVVISIPDEDLAERLRRHERILKQIGYMEHLRIGVGLEKPAGSATDVVGRIEVFVPLKGVLDIEGERDRLQKKIEKIDAYLEGLLRKLADRNFLDRAPAEVVAREKARCRGLEEEAEKLRASLAELERQ